MIQKVIISRLFANVDDVQNVVRAPITQNFPQDLNSKQKDIYLYFIIIIMPLIIKMNVQSE